ncbi:hypothetical protein [Deinococcus radiophilus]|uniref:hypothetical protein n=1 Tax=Deinococcus radiophilus TaxID=32062 RepID=UPI00360AE803
MTRLVSLLEPHEYELLGLTDYAEQAKAQDIEIISYPVRDVSVPEDLASFHKMVDRVLSELLDGERVVIHCRGAGAGLGPRCLPPGSDGHGGRRSH